jgi:predicted amidohydrolase YtcJ
MITIKYVCLLSLMLLFVSCTKSPDIIYYNGKIYTLDSNNSKAEAIAVKDGKIIDIGSNDDISNKYKSSEKVDLQGNTVLPGLIDADGSLIEFSLELSRFNNLIDLRNCTKVEHITKLVEEKVKNQKKDIWIGGYGWNENNISDANDVNMNKSTLDKISTEFNIYLVNIDGTIVWCNSKMLETLQITKETPSPADGEIDKNENGELSGFLFGSAVNIIKEKLPKFTREDMVNSVEAGAKELLKYGITEIHDRSVNTEAISVFKELIDKDKFPIKIYAVLTGNDDSFEEYLKKGIEINYKDKLTVRAVTIDYDGSLELQSAAMKDGYISEPKRKNPYTDIATVERILRKSIDKNFQFSAKTVGDKAVNDILNIVEKIKNENGNNDLRIKLESVEFIQPGDLKRIKELKIIPSVKPEENMYDIDLLPVRISYSNYNNFALWNYLLQSAGKITSGSGFPFSRSINPFVQMYYLSTRQFLDTIVKNIPMENQKISLFDAVKSYTIWSAYAGFEETERGSLEKGKMADMIVISNDIFNNDLKALANTKVIKTIIKGKVMYDYAVK